MICPLCRKKEANKNNTHYLTDGIIRNCLNLEGAKQRELGYYFDLSNNDAFVEFNFQRGTSIEKLEEGLGRSPTDIEIDKAKIIPFSVDNVFCSECEDLFTEIESSFIENYLPNFRDTDLGQKKLIEITNIKNFRLFMYLQVWRTHICEEKVKLNDKTAEELRLLILNYKISNLDAITSFPLSVTYLETTGGEKEFTTNIVGFTNDKNPYIIFLNDFVIQFFDRYEDIRFIDFYGLNLADNFLGLVNYKEQRFSVRIMQNSCRKKFLSEFIKAEKIKQTLQFYENYFNNIWTNIFGVMPPRIIVKEYINEIIGGDFEVLKYSREKILEVTQRFIKKKLGKH
jgi:hypothetical protein